MGTPTKWLLGVSLLVLLGCEQGMSGVAEPFRVRDAQFIQGVLPGMRPRAKGDAGGADAADAGAPQGPPAITSIETFNLDVFQGQGGKAFRGRAGSHASAVLLAFEGAGSGYWVVPTGAPDPVTDELTWTAVTDFDVSIKTGKHALRVVAIDDQGRAGLQLELSVCVLGRVPDNHSACNPDKQPPRAVISLQWDVNADLDLLVVDSEGRVIDAKHPSTVSQSPDAGTASGDGAMLDRDSNAGCAIDGLRTENLVWNTTAPEGRYGIYVNLFDACKQPAVRFRLFVYTALAEDEAASGFWTPRLQESGELLDLAADPAADRGLFIAEFAFN
jgi:hypothetical protein